MQILQEDNKKLRSKLSTLTWPPLESFTARDQVHQLPLTSKAKSLTAPTEEHLQYLTGFFDGDGCATAGQSPWSCALAVWQSYDNAEILLLFQAAFGGGIYAGGFKGVGLAKPGLQWKVYGSRAKLAARQLLTGSSTKKRQLELIANWPEDISIAKQKAGQLRRFKEWDSAVDFKCNWSYCAGFFDADGCLTLRTNGSIILAFCQKFPTVLDHIARFLTQMDGVTPRICRVRDSLFSLRVEKKTESKLLLQRMLAAGLFKKAPQAQLALNATPENTGLVRVRLAQFVGNQQHGRRLDEAGARRALQIQRLQAQVRYSKGKGQHQKAAALCAEVQALKLEHTLLKAQLENSQLRNYIQMVESLQHSGWQAPEQEKMTEVRRRP